MVNIEEENQEIFEEAENFALWQYRSISKYVYGRVIEIGSGNGRITKLISENRNVESVTGVDTNRRYIKNANKLLRGKNIRFEYLDLSKEEIPKKYRNSFDVMVSINVLEHIKNDEEVLRKCRNLLKENGRAVILVPGIKFLYGNLDRGQNHFRRFSRGELRGKMSRAGFRVEKVFAMNFFGTFSWLYQSRILGLKIIRQNDVHIFDSFVPLFRFLECVPIPFGLSYIAVGRKE